MLCSNKWAVCAPRLIPVVRVCAVSRMLGCRQPAGGSRPNGPELRLGAHPRALAPAPARLPPVRARTALSAGKSAAPTRTLRDQAAVDGRKSESG